jgi:MYXO-CTERM domain-containing protein
VCSDHVDATGTFIRIDGLENNTEYQFLVVAYDAFGNPRVMSDGLLTATPAETSDFWEQCEQQGDLCGSGGFCSCRSEPDPSGAAWLGTGLLLLGLARRRRRGLRA